MIEFKLGNGFRELTVVTRPKKHLHAAWTGFSTFRTVHKRRVAFVMWRGKNYWIRQA